MSCLNIGSVPYPSLCPKSNFKVRLFFWHLNTLLKYFTFTYVSPLLLKGAQAIDKCLPFHSVVGSSFYISPVEPTPEHFCLIFSPAVLGATSFPCSLWVPYTVSVCWVMFVAGLLRVCPIQLHFLLRISKSVGSWFVLFRRSTLVLYALLPRLHVRSR